MCRRDGRENISGLRSEDACCSRNRWCCQQFGCRAESNRILYVSFEDHLFEQEADNPQKRTKSVSRRDKDRKTDGTAKEQSLVSLTESKAASPAELRLCPGPSAICYFCCCPGRCAAASLSTTVVNLVFRCNPLLQDRGTGRTKRRREWRCSGRERRTGNAIPKTACLPFMFYEPHFRKGRASDKVKRPLTQRL